MNRDSADPKGLVRESYRIDGIGDDECRSILVDWALSLAPGTDETAALRTLIARHGDGAPDHPMTALLHAGLSGMTARRRGGRAARIAPQD